MQGMASPPPELCRTLLSFSTILIHGIIQTTITIYVNYCSETMQLSIPHSGFTLERFSFAEGWAYMKQSNSNYDFTPFPGFFSMYMESWGSLKDHPLASPSSCQTFDDHFQFSIPFPISISISVSSFYICPSIGVATVATLKPVFVQIHCAYELLRCLLYLKICRFVLTIMTTT